LKGERYLFTNQITIPAPAENEEVTITKKKKPREHLPGYTLWGNGNTTKLGGTSMSVIDMFMKLGKAEMELMKFLENEMRINRNNGEKLTTVVEPSKSDEYTNYIKTAIKKHYSHMECLGILQRVKRGKYMLNPRLFIPTKNVEEHMRAWDELESVDCQEEEV